MRTGINGTPSPGSTGCAIGLAIIRADARIRSVVVVLSRQPAGGLPYHDSIPGRE